MTSNRCLLKTEKPVIADCDLDCTGAPPAWLCLPTHAGEPRPFQRPRPPPLPCVVVSVSLLSPGWINRSVAPADELLS
jgi:hypothetical protein